VELNVSEQRDNCRRETETRRQRDGRDGPITPSRSVVATREGLSGVFRGSLRAKSPEARSQVSGRFDIPYLFHTSVGTRRLCDTQWQQAPTPLTGL